MSKKILLTGASDGIGLEAAKLLAAQGHQLLLHGRSARKLEQAKNVIGESDALIETYLADLSDLNQVADLAADIKSKHASLDVIINNAGVFKTSAPVSAAGLDVRFVVNTIAPYILTMQLLPLMPDDGRVVNISSAAQQPVDLAALRGDTLLSDAMQAYAQSKLAITMWTRQLAHSQRQSQSQSQSEGNRVFVSVNPGSLLASKMVKEGFGVEGKDIGIGADILTRAAVSEEFADASGKYFDNDIGAFGDPHPDALNDTLCASVASACSQFAMEAV